MNRRILIAFLLLYFVVHNSEIYAQQNDTIFTNKHRHELELGLGTSSLLFELGNAFSLHNKARFSINIHSQYMYNISKHFSIGANLTYSAYYLEYFKGGCEEQIKIGESDYYHLFTLGLTGRAYWFYKKNWAMYSKYGLTLSISSNGGSTWFWPLNFSLVGIEVGDKHWRGYMEPLCLFSTWPAAHIGIKYLF